MAGRSIDHHDRRVVGLVAQSVAWVASIACAVQAWAGNERVWVLYLITAVWNGAFAVTGPARSSIYPRILPREQLPAANALSVFAMNTSMTVAPCSPGSSSPRGVSPRHTPWMPCSRRARWRGSRAAGDPARTSPVTASNGGDCGRSGTASPSSAPGPTSG